MQGNEMSFKEKLKSISFSTGRPAPKKSTDVHDSHVVEVTEHWDDRVDVAVKQGETGTWPPAT